MTEEKKVIQTTQTTRVQNAPAVEQAVFTFKVRYIIWLLFGILESLILLRFGLKLIAANPASPFAALIYNFTDIFLFPFAGLTSTPAAGGMVLEISSLIAIFVYALLAWTVERIVWVAFYRPYGL